MLVLMKLDERSRVDVAEGPCSDEGGEDGNEGLYDTRLIIFEGSALSFQHTLLKV